MGTSYIPTFYRSKGNKPDKIINHDHFANETTNEGVIMGERYLITHVYNILWAIRRGGGHSNEKVYWQTRDLKITQDSYTEVFETAIFPCNYPIPGSAFSLVADDSGIDADGCLHIFAEIQNLDLRFTLDNVTRSTSRSITLSEASAAIVAHDDKLRFPDTTEPEDLLRITIEARSNAGFGTGYIRSICIAEPPLTSL